jgi:hypothetical protein
MSTSDLLTNNFTSFLYTGPDEHVVSGYFRNDSLMRKCMTDDLMSQIVTNYIRDNDLRILKLSRSLNCSEIQYAYNYIIATGHNFKFVKNSRFDCYQSLYYCRHTDGQYYTVILNNAALDESEDVPILVVDTIIKDYSRVIIRPDDDDTNSVAK